MVKLPDISHDDAFELVMDVSEGLLDLEVIARRLNVPA